MYFTIYKITNKINGKVYIGKHKTTDLNDTYMGSGKILKRAIKKHGINNFIKTYLFIYDNEEDMNNKEKELVNESFIKEDSNYNLNIGGEGGWDYVNRPENVTQRIKGGLVSQQLYRDNIELDILRRENLSRKMTGNKNYIKMVASNKEKYPNGTFYGKTHSDETKAKMRKPKNIGKYNSQYGTMWIYSLVEKRNTKINKNDDIPEGWYKGRKMKF